jgi:4-amino-4-deoxy-L-arabinose transferase-like glycosyltransferase
MRRAACILARVRDRRDDALGVFLVALMARLGIVVWAHARFPAVEDGHYYDVLARRIAGGAGYTWLWPDGAVTYVAHYPVGYPAILATGYALFGATAWVAMTLNAVLGAASAYAAHRLVDGGSVARWRPAAAGAAVALHPALVPYTAALMTEGVTASLLVVAAALVATARGSRRPWAVIAGVGLVLGVATLVRPQCLALAPVFGALAVPDHFSARLRLGAVVAVSALALACVLPWTARNCLRMHRCALVSVNGGWNLLIGATTETGAWMPMPVPAECATVWDEAAKDACFERAAWRDIERSPSAWLARAPSKLAATFDYFGAAPWYLHASNAEAFDDGAKAALGAAETVACRLLLLGALVTCGRMPGRRSRLRKGVALAGAIAAVTLHAWLGYAAIPLMAALAGTRALVRGPMLVPMAAALIAATAAVHAVFFGAGRYGLVVAPFVAALAFASTGGARADEGPDLGPTSGARPAGEPGRRAVAEVASAGHIAGVDAARAVAGHRRSRRGREESPSSTEHDAG